MTSGTPQCGRRALKSGPRCNLNLNLNLNRTALLRILHMLPRLQNARTRYAETDPMPSPPLHIPGADQPHSSSPFSSLFRSRRSSSTGLAQRLL